MPSPSSGTEELRLATAVEGVRLHWLRGLQLGALAGVVVLAGLVAVRSYGSSGALTWPLAFVAAYLLAFFLVFQLLLWPLAVAERERPLPTPARGRGLALVRRPGASIGLALALLLINALGAAAAVLPLLDRHRCVLVRRGRALRAAAPTRGGPALMASVTFDDVSKRFDADLVVDDLSLEIADGEFLVLVGPSGCGKSTALRMLAGLEEVTSGRVLIGDRVVNNLAPGARDLAMVFQSYALYPHMTVYDNLAFGLRNTKVAKAEIERRVTNAAEILDLERADQAQAEAALGRPAAACRAGSRDRPRARRVPDGRAALQPRRGAARPDAGGDPEAPAAPRRRRSTSPTIRSRR